MNKTCTYCNENKPLSEFPPDNRRENAYRSRCRTCLNELSRSKLAKERLTVEGKAKQLFNGARTRARTKGIPFDITLDWLIETLKSNPRCAVTGIDFLYTDDKVVNFHTPSIDQINPGSGYTEDNIQIVTWMYNQMKNQYSDKMIVNFAYELVKHQEFMRMLGQPHIGPAFHIKLEEDKMPKKKINIYERRRHWIQRYKKLKGCQECGYNKSARALCFDHQVPGSKHSMVKNGLRNTSYGGGMANLMRAKYPLEVLMNEIRKCIVLCQNCHAEKTEREQEKGKRG